MTFPARPLAARTSSLPQRPRWTARALWGLLRATLAKWSEDQAPRLGAALAYYTVFSLAPLLVIAITISGLIFGQELAQERIVAQIAGLIGMPGAVAVNRLIDNARLPANAGLAVTIASAGAVLLGALGAFSELLNAFDTIWDRPPQRGGLLHIVRSRLTAFGLVLVAGFLLLLSLVANTTLSALSGYLMGRLPYPGLLAAGANLVLPLLLSTVLFALMFRYLPRVALTWRQVWPGAILTGVLFTLGKSVIAAYLARSPLTTAAGAAGSILIVMLWVYYSAQILFFGAEFTQVLVRHSRPPVAEPGARTRLPRQPAVAAPPRDPLPPGGSV